MSERSARPPEELAPGVHFWRVFGTDAVGMDTTPPSFVWEFFAPHRSTPRDDVRGNFLDVNGDGHADIVAGVGEELSGERSRIGIAVYPGGATGPREEASQLFIETGGFQIPCVNLIGDVNGDGFGDLLWGCNHFAPMVDRQSPPRAAAEVLFGSPGGLIRASPAYQITGNGSWPLLGEYASPIGDMNDDGYGDMALGLTLGPAMPTLQNRPTLYWGSSSGPEDARRQTILPPPTSILHWGYYLEGNIGDVDGDGDQDLLVGALTLSANEVQHTFLYRGARGATPPSYASLIVGRTHSISPPRVADRRAGPCDMNGDGLADFAFASRDETAGAIAVYRGRSPLPPLWQPDVVTRPVLRRGPEAFSMGASCAGDINGDGYSDLLAYGSGVTSGLWVLPGSPELTSSWQEVLEEGAEVPEVWHYTVGGDIDRDGLSDAVLLEIEEGMQGRGVVRLRAWLGDRVRGVARPVRLQAPGRLSLQSFAF